MNLIRQSMRLFSIMRTWAVQLAKRKQRQSLGRIHQNDFDWMRRANLDAESQPKPFQLLEVRAKPHIIKLEGYWKIATWPRIYSDLHNYIKARDWCYKQNHSPENLSTRGALDN